MSELTFFQRLVSRLVLVYFFVCILILLFLHKLRDWFHGQDSHSDFSHTISFCETKLQKLRNPCVVTQLMSSKNNVFGYPLTLKISSSSECQCHILVNVPTERLHTALTDKFEVLKSYLIKNAAGTKTVHAGTESLRINVNDFEPFRVTYGNKRTHYSAVIAFVTDSETVDEQIVSVVLRILSSLPLIMCT
ncbi:hypothetical protein AHF37_09523 [Paragonimus kellicotti]|nr:hypothetical protein AHF37_09523 [Paragonimus kellicotti]